jgi:hypothetical protein
MVRYTSAEKLDTDDFGDNFSHVIGEVVYDAKTRMGPWATMTATSWRRHGAGALGTGHGQKYVRHENGELHKVKG